MNGVSRRARGAGRGAAPGLGVAVPRIAPRYQWEVRSPSSPRTADELLAVLLELRGVAAHAAEAFFSPPYAASLHDAALLPQCGAAVARLRRALAFSEPIAVFGDYDVDGITASAVLAEALTALGGSVLVDLPHREEGYGLSEAAVRRLVPPACLLVTVDNGVSAGEAVASAIARGADVIIIDHHAVNGALPPGALVVHPALPSSKYPNPGLAAVGVAWKVAASVLDAEGRAGEERFLLDLVALGTLADSMPLRGENRALVYWGLEVLRRTRRPGLRVLAEQAGVDLGSLQSHEAVFKLIPRLNAAGRLRHASLALDLLRTPDDGVARRLALELEAVNSERKALTEELMAEARAQVQSLSGVVFVAGPWPPGLLGILASRLAEECGRPAVAVSVRDGECVASIRGDGTNVVGLVREAEDLLTRFGGHQGAAGFSFPRSALGAVAAFFRSHPSIPAVSRQPALPVDCALPLDLVNADLARTLDRFEPLGEGNERPHFLFPAVSTVESRPVGATGDHARFTFRDPASAAVASGIAFRWGERARPATGEIVDVVAEVRFDAFRGVPRADLHIQDLRSSGGVGES